MAFRNWLGFAGGLALSLFLAQGAAASGTARCSFDDRMVRFEFGTVYSHGLGEAFSGSAATLQVRGRDIPKDLSNIDLSDGLVHHWLRGPRLDLRFYQTGSEGRSLNEVEVIVNTMQQKGSETDFVGRYELRISYRPKAGAEPIGFNRLGRVACSVG